MPEIHGEAGPRLRERIGSLAQVIRVDSFVEADGWAAGSRRLRLVNGGGLEIEVHPDRALDIGQVTVHGVPFAWISPTGITGPDAAEPTGSGWLRTFGGGLLATCGLDTFGPPSRDDGEELGQHGRIGAQRAKVTRAEATAEGVVVEGVIRQARVFGENLVLRRRISSPAGSDVVVIEDTVTNESFRHQPHMVLYHVNLGWPLLGDNTTIAVPSERVTPRDSEAAGGMAAHDVFGAPTPRFQEQVFIHELPATERVEVVVHNPDNGLEFAMTVDPTQLGTVFVWKMTGQGHYALGIEPANTAVMGGRAAARADDRLPHLAPGECASYTVTVRLRVAGSAAGPLEVAA